MMNNFNKMSDYRNGKKFRNGKYYRYNKLSDIIPNFDSISLEWMDEFDGQVFRWSGRNAMAFCCAAVEKYQRKGRMYSCITKRYSYAYRTMSEWINDKNIFDKISDYIINWAKRFSVEGVYPSYPSNDEDGEDEDWECDDDE